VVSGQLHDPAALSPEKSSRYPFDTRLGGPPQPVRTTWRREIFWAYRDSNCDPIVLQLVSSCYTDYAIQMKLVPTLYIRSTFRRSSSVSGSYRFVLQNLFPYSYICYSDRTICPVLSPSICFMLSWIYFRFLPVFSTGIVQPNKDKKRVKLSL
jgi:hypothetical protein